MTDDPLEQLALESRYIVGSPFRHQGSVFSTEQLGTPVSGELLKEVDGHWEPQQVATSAGFPFVDKRRAR